MEFLENLADPKKVAWLAQNLICVSDASRGKLYRHYAKLLATCVCKDLLYAKEVCLLMAFAAVDRNETAATVTITPRTMTAKHSPEFGQRLLQDVEHTLRIGTSDMNVFRLYAYLHTVAYYNQQPHSVLNVYDRDVVAYNRIQRLMVGFSKETTFKVHGDAMVHAEILACLLPMFMTSLLGYLQTPFQLAAISFPETVNDHVRPLLDEKIESRLASVDWHGNHRVKDIILVFGLVVEIVGKQHICIINAAMICKGDKTLPLPYVIRTPDGKLEAGIRYLGNYAAFDKTDSVCGAVAHWLKLCAKNNIDGTKNVHDAIFDEPSDVNPLCKYFRSHGD